MMKRVTRGFYYTPYVERNNMATQQERDIVGQIVKEIVNLHNDLDFIESRIQEVNELALKLQELEA